MRSEKKRTTAKKKKHSTAKKKLSSSEKKRISRRIRGEDSEDKLDSAVTLLKAKSPVLTPTEIQRKRLDSVFAAPLEQLERKRQKLASDPDSKLGLSSTITKGSLKGSSASALMKPDVTTARYTKGQSTTALAATSAAKAPARTSVADLMKKGRQFVRAKTALRPLVQPTSEKPSALHGSATIMTPTSKKGGMLGKACHLERTMPVPDSAKKRSHAAAAAASAATVSDDPGLMREFASIKTMLSSFHTEIRSDFIETIKSLKPKLLSPHQQLQLQQQQQTLAAPPQVMHDPEDRKLIEALQNEKLRLLGEKGELEVTVGTLRSRQNALEMEVEEYKSVAKTRLAEIERVTEEKNAVLTRMGSAAQEIEAVEVLCRAQKTQIAELQAALSAKTELVAQMKAKLDENEMIRRRLHNEVQELKGNIRVFCRVRPPIDKDTPGEASIFAYSPADPGKVEVSEQTLSVRGEQQVRKYEFSYDRVFGPETTQEQVFEELSQLVQSALDGYSCCVFAYGQTGSGKTYTMEGPSSASGEDALFTAESPQRGVIPRAVEQIFAAVERLRELGWEYTVEVSFLEVYNEQLRDLLAKDSQKPKQPQLRGQDVQGCRVLKVTAPADVYTLLDVARKNRVVAETKYNEHSSRSHSVFRLHIRGYNAKRGETVTSILNLVDLAGSERLDAGCDKAERKKETQNINKSLMNLRNVITALAENRQHIPYRESVLTILLQSSLGGHAKTLMFVNVSPAPESIKQTLGALRFASTANKCHIGTAQRQATSDKQ